VNKAYLNRAPRIAAVALVAIALTEIAPAMAQSATAQQNAGAGNAGADPAQVDQGKATFASKCSHCHGPNMVNSGTITPDLRRFPNDKERFVTTVKSGKNGKMPPWGDVLNDQEIADLWAYVSSRRTP
jgi:mono/diheme cytochrome c family protein